jgi:hypothetical protein
MVKRVGEQRHVDILDLVAMGSFLHYTNLPLSADCDEGTCVRPLCQHKMQLHPVNECVTMIMYGSAIGLIREGEVGPQG